MDVREFVERQQLVERGPVSERVRQALLSAIADGSLVAGDALQDAEWADAFGASRTPVRDAFQYLHGMGLLDVAAARYTRLRMFTPQAAVEEAHDWAVLHEAVIQGVVSQVPGGLVERLRRVGDEFSCQESSEHIRSGSFRFFHVLRGAVPHSAVTLGATAAAYRLRLAGAMLDHTSGSYDALHAGVVQALVRGEVEHAREAFAAWRRVEIAVAA